VLLGGGVYYGLSPIEGETAIERKVDPIAPKQVTVKKVAEAHPHPERKPAKDKQEDTTSKKKWIDQYVNKSPENKDADEVKAKDMKAEARKAKEMAKKEMIRAEKEEMMREKAKGKFVVKEDKPSSAIGRMESFDTIDIIMREAEEIESTDLRDRAYLNVVDYALMHGYFGKAKAALAKISQPELRETARSRIAVNYAGTGNPEAAFDLVDSVEMTDFKDAMRIQIIEALIAAESLQGTPH